MDGSLTRSAQTMQDLAQICTMFKDSRSQAFEPKVAVFQIRCGDLKLGSARKHHQKSAGRGGGLG